MNPNKTDIRSKKNLSDFNMMEECIVNLYKKV
jgi:hypothetical protein